MSEPPENPTPAAGGGGGASKVAQQLTKMRDANVKYKNLLKMAKDRITQQDEELKKLRESNKQQQADRDQKQSSSWTGMGDADVVGDMAEHGCNIVKICQRIRVDLDAHEMNSKGGTDQIWALIDYELFDPDQNDAFQIAPPKRIKKWNKFDAESELSDFIRRDTGEPLALPPYSLTPQQSARIQEESEKNVSKITEEFRRFRVKSEMARKQADAHIRELQSSNVETAKRRIEGPNVEKELEQARSEHSQLERMRAEMAKQEAQWKEAYDLLLSENETLKSTGSEALLASQWRHRYEACLKEKEEAESSLAAERERQEADDAGKYEMKYRDLKESFRLYRKKAKEIFEAQQTGQPTAQLVQISDRSSEDSKLSYLKNLMVNYFVSDLEVREHMEAAIGTVLQFTPDDLAKIESKKAEGDYWAYLGY